MFNVAEDDDLYEEIEEEQNVSPPSKNRLVLWLVIMSLSGLLLPLFLISKTLEETNLGLVTQLEALEAQLAAPPTPDAALVALEDQVSGLRTQVSELQAILTTIEAGAVNWPRLMVGIGGYDQQQITVTTLVQTGSRIVISGQAVDESAIVAYTRALEDTGLFKRVFVESITLETGKENTQRIAEFALLLEVKPNEQ